MKNKKTKIEAKTFVKAFISLLLWIVFIVSGVVLSAMAIVGLVVLVPTITILRAVDEDECSVTNKVVDIVKSMIDCLKRRLDDIV